MFTNNNDNTALVEHDMTKQNNPPAPLITHRQVTSNSTSWARSFWKAVYVRHPKWDATKARWVFGLQAEAMQCNCGSSYPIVEGMKRAGKGVKLQVGDVCTKLFTQTTHFEQHLKTNHQVTPSTDLPQHVTKSRPIKINDAFSDVRQKKLLERASFSDSPECNQLHKQMSFFSGNVAWRLIEDEPYKDQFNEAQKQLMCFNRRDVPQHMLNSKIVVTKFQLQRFRGSAGILCTDSGTRIHRYLPIYFHPVGFQAILLCFIDTNNLCNGRTTGVEINRVLHFCTKKLKDDFNIDITCWVADSAANMQTSHTHNHLTQTDIAELNLSKECAVSAVQSDEWYPAVADGAGFSDADLRPKKRDTCHVIQLIWNDLQETAFLKRIRNDLMPRLIDIHKKLLNGVRVKVVDPEDDQQLIDAIDYEHRSPEDYQLMVSPANEGSETRWWCTFNYWMDIREQLQECGYHETAFLEFDNFATKIVILKTASTAAESPSSTFFDSFTIIDKIDQLKRSFSTPNYNAMKVKVANRMPMLVSEIEILIAWFFPCIFFGEKPRLLALLGGDWVQTKLKLIFGDEVAAEYDDFRFGAYLLPEAVIKSAKSKKSLSMNQLFTWWKELFDVDQPQLAKALQRLVLSHHTEIACERAFSQLQGLANDLRTLLSPSSVHSTMCLRNNWSVPKLNPAASRVFPVDATLDHWVCQFAVDCLFSGPYAKLSIADAKKAIEESKDNLDGSDEMLGEIENAANVLALVNDAGTRRARQDDDQDETKKKKKPPTKQQRRTRLEREQETLNQQRRVIFDEKRAAGELEEGEEFVEVTDADFACANCGKLPIEHTTSNDPDGQSDKMFECSGCEKWIHSECVGVNKSLFTALERTKEFFCRACRVRIRTEKREQARVRKEAAKKKEEAAVEAAEEQCVEQDAAPPTVDDNDIEAMLAPGGLLAVGLEVEVD